MFVFVHVPPIFSVLLTYSLKINSLLFWPTPYMYVGIYMSFSRHNVKMLRCGCTSLSPYSHTYIIGIPSPTHSFTLGLNPSFSANPPYRSLSFVSFKIHYMDFLDCLLLLLSISVFLLFSFFCFYTFYSCRFPCGRLSWLMLAFNYNHLTASFPGQPG